MAIVWGRDRVMGLSKGEAIALRANALRKGRIDIADLAEERIDHFDARAAGRLAASVVASVCRAADLAHDVVIKAQGLVVRLNYIDRAGTAAVARRTFGTDRVAQLVASKARRALEVEAKAVRNTAEGLVLDMRDVSAHVRATERGAVEVQDHVKGFWVRCA